MKKTIFFILLVLLLCCCAELTPTANLTTVPKLERNPDCMSMHRFKVFQTFEDKYALAYECKNDDGVLKDSCLGAVVLLTPMSGIDFYDDMLVTIPEKKCAVQNGVYRYETRDNFIKTVPRIEYGQRSEKN